MGQGAHFPASRSAQGPEPHRVGAMPFLPLKHRCSRGGCTTATMNVDALKRTRTAWPLSTRQQSWGFAVNWTELPSCYTGLKKRQIKEFKHKAGYSLFWLAVLRWISLTDHRIKPKIWSPSLTKMIWINNKAGELLVFQQRHNAVIRNPHLRCDG